MTDVTVGPCKFCGHWNQDADADLAAALAERDTYKTAWEQSDKACRDLSEKVLPNVRAERDALADRVAELESEKVEAIRKKFEAHAELTVRQAFQWPHPPYDYMEPDIQRRFEAYAVLSREEKS